MLCLTALAFASFLRPSLIITIGMDLSSGVHESDRYAKNSGRQHIQVHRRTLPSYTREFSKNSKSLIFLSYWQETAK